MSELKPCPFCGASAEVWSDRDRTWGLVRHHDGCLFPNFRNHEISECDFDTWNTRAVESASGLVYIPSFRDNGEFPEHIWASLGGETIAYFRERTCHDTGESRVFQCSECGFGLWDVYMDDETEWDVSFCDFPPYCPKCGARVERGE